MDIKRIDDNVLKRMIELHFKKDYSAKEAMEIANKELNTNGVIVESETEECYGWRFRQLKF